MKWIARTSDKMAQYDPISLGTTGVGVEVEVTLQCSMLTLRSLRHPS
jgi:hypothetical protein